MLDISPILLLSSGLVFLLVLARLNSCLYKPLFKHMDERDEQIKNDMANAKNNATDVDGMIEEANSIISQAKKEAFLIREKAKFDAIEIADVRITDVKARIVNRYNDFTKALELEKITLKSSLTNDIPLFKEGLKAKLSSI